MAVNVYRELASLEADLGYSAKALYSLSNSLDRHYRNIKILKRGGGDRQLSVPDRFLKSVQRRIADTLLFYEDISPYATAYRYGGSPIVNAKPHVGHDHLLKLDVRHFFDSLTYPLVKEKAFPKEKYAENLRILLTLICVYKDTLPQGAPTSPAISNIIMCDFDNRIGSWCENRGIAYTRYCDDMTFSGSFDHRLVIDLVQTELHKLGLRLNDEKTAVVRNGRRKTVTGLVVNEKLHIASSYRRQIRQEMYYCMKYGVQSHMERRQIEGTAQAYIQRMLGKIHYALSVGYSEELMAYCQWLNAAGAALRSNT